MRRRTAFPALLAGLLAAGAPAAARPSPPAVPAGADAAAGTAIAGDAGPGEAVPGTQSPVTAVPGEADAARCGAARLASYIGQAPTIAVLAAIQQAIGPLPIRTLAQGAAAMPDVRADRLTIELTPDGKIARFGCY